MKSLSRQSTHDRRTVENERHAKELRHDDRVAEPDVVPHRGHTLQAEERRRGRGRQGLRRRRLRRQDQAGDGEGVHAAQGGGETCGQGVHVLSAERGAGWLWCAGVQAARERLYTGDGGDRCVPRYALQKHDRSVFFVAR